MCGCGSNPAIAVSSADAPVITTQPAPESTPLGQNATFTVVANGTAPLVYQWSKNGTPVSGATQATYVTPAVQASDSGSTFSVTVSNIAGSVNSHTAALTVGPRSPIPGDLRFHQVDAPSTKYGPTLGGRSVNLLPGERVQYTNWLGVPFELGPDICLPGVQGGCTWFYAALYLPDDVSGLGATYQSDAMDKFATDLALYSAPNMVINSLDEEPGNDIFALESANTSQTTGFALTHSIVNLSDLQGLATQLGSQSQVITAVSFNGAGQLDVLSYSWQGDPSTTYDALVAPVRIDTIAAQAQQLANSGYIITAFGGNAADGFVLVGTKVQGDSIPRPLYVADGFASVGAGYAAVAMPTNWDTNPYTPIWIFEQ